MVLPMMGLLAESTLADQFIRSIPHLIGFLDVIAEVRLFLGWMLINRVLIGHSVASISEE